MAFFGQSAHFKLAGRHSIDLFLYLDGSLIFNLCCVLSIEYIRSLKLSMIHLKLNNTIHCRKEQSVLLIHALLDCFPACIIWASLLSFECYHFTTGENRILLFIRHTIPAIPKHLSIFILKMG